MKRIVLLFAVFLACYAGIGQSPKKFFSNGLKKYNQEEYLGAMSDFTNAIGKNPAYAEAYYYRGLCRRSIKLASNACSSVNIIQFTPAEPLPAEGTGSKTCKAVDYRAVSDSLDAILSIHPRDPKALFERGVARAALKDYQGAIDDFTKAIELAPASGTAYIERSSAKSAIQDIAGSQADLKTALAVDPRCKVETYNFDGSLFGSVQSGEIDDYSMAIKLNPAYADAFLARGLARIKMKRKDEGCEDLRQAAALGHKTAEAEIIKFCP
jgi:tetratricopeptide (TPR) repeat protein